MLIYTQDAQESRISIKVGTIVLFLSFRRARILCPPASSRLGSCLVSLVSLVSFMSLSSVPPLPLRTHAKEPHKLPNAQTTESTAGALAHCAVTQRLLLLLQSQNTLLDRVANDQSLDLDRAGLADTMRAVDGLVLCARVSNDT